MTTATLDFASPLHRTAMIGRHRAQPEVSARSYVLAGVALSAASAVAFAPLIEPTTAAGRSELSALAPAVSRNVALAAVVSNADIAALVNNLNASLGSISTTVASVVGVPGQTLGGALISAAALNDHLWDGLLAANGNPVLKTVLTALKNSSSGGLTQLANTVGAANGTIVLTTGEVANILTSTLTGSLGTALQAVTNVVANPLSVASYTGLLNTPVDLAGGVLTGALNAVNTLGDNALTLTNSLVNGVTAQVSNALSLVNGLLQAAGGVTDFALVDGVLTALQGIVSAPVTAAVAGINGLSSTITGAAADTLDKLTTGATRLVGTWLGDGTSPGVVQAVITTIGAAPLSPASYTAAVSALVGAGINSAQIVASTAGSFVSLPFSVASGLTGTAAGVITSFNSGLATVASGILQAAGVGPLISNLPYLVSAAVNGAVNVAATVTQAALNTITTALNFGSALTGARTAAVAHTATDVPSLAASDRTVTLDVATTATDARPSATQSSSGTKTSADDTDIATKTSEPTETTEASGTPDIAVATKRPAEESGDTTVTPKPTTPATATPAKGTAASTPATSDGATTPTAPATTHKTTPAGGDASSSGSTPRHGADTSGTPKTPTGTPRDRDRTHVSGTPAAPAPTAASGRPSSTGTDSGAAESSSAAATAPKADSHNDAQHTRTAGTSERSAAGNSHDGGAS